MRCPICHNLRSSGRCPHTLTERSDAMMQTAKIHASHRAGRIDSVEMMRQLQQINRSG